MSEVPNFVDMRVVELRTECEKRGLDKSGNKQALVDRLQEVSMLLFTYNLMLPYPFGYYCDFYASL